MYVGLVRERNTTAAESISRAKVKVTAGLFPATGRGNLSLTRVHSPSTESVKLKKTSSSAALIPYLGDQI